MSGETTEPPWVFVSYSRADQKAAQEVIAALEAAGITAWWDGQLDGGARYNEVTEHKLENAYAVVTLWSQTSTHSHWVHDEAMRGRDRGCLVPASIDGSEPPLGFRQFQWITLASKPGAALDRTALENLVHAVERMHPDSEGRANSVPHAAPAPLQPAKIGGIDRRMALGGGAALLVLGGGALAWTGGLFGGGAKRNSVAVLPFEAIGGEAGHDYFSDGLAAEIRSRLARNPLLKVAAQASSNSFRDSDASATEIARSLDVAYLLDGNVRRDGDRVKVSAELIDGKSGFATLTPTFEQPLEGIFQIQEAIAAAVIGELSNQLDDGASVKGVGGTESVAAYEAYLRGRELYDAGTDEASDREALAKFEEAIRLDPNYAAAYAGKSRALSLIGNLYADSDERSGVYGRAVEAAQEAVRIAPDYPDGHSNLGFALAMGQLDMRAARTPYQRSLELAPGDADILSRYAIFQSRIGNASAAEAQVARAAALDPLNARVFRLKGDIAYSAQKPVEAIEAFEMSRSIQETISSFHYRVGLAQLELGEFQAAKESFAEESFFVWRHTGGAIAEHRLGNTAAAGEHLAALKAEYGDKSSYQYAQIYGQWGETAEAEQALADAWRLKDSGLTQLYHDPLLAPLHETGEYKGLIKRMGFV